MGKNIHLNLVFLDSCVFPTIDLNTYPREFICFSFLYFAYAFLSHSCGFPICVFFSILCSTGPKLLLGAVQHMFRMFFYFLHSCLLGPVYFLWQNFCPTLLAHVLDKWI